MCFFCTLIGLYHSSLNLSFVYWDLGPTNRLQSESWSFTDYWPIDHPLDFHLTLPETRPLSFFNEPTGVNHLLVPSTCILITLYYQWRNDGDQKGGAQ